MLGKSIKECSRRFGKFRKDDSGSSSIEAALWVPLFAMLLVLITDTSFIFYGRAMAMRIVQDGNRAYSVGRLTTNEEARDYITNALTDISPNATVTTELTMGVIISTVIIPVNDLMPIGSIPGFRDFNIAVSSQHFLES